MAPFFGSSTIIWANTIAVVLLALSAGYKLGGMLADRRPGRRCAGWCCSAARCSVVPFIAHPFLSLSVSAFDPLSAGAFTASLFGTLVLVAMPLLLLGAVSPWATRLRLASIEEAGSVAGRLYAISTVGSLVGVFFVALWAIEAIGTQRTFLVLAAIPALAAARGRTLLVPRADRRAGDPTRRHEACRRGPRVLYEKETPYQYARVIEEDDGTRKLELNEGQAIHSLWRAGTVLTEAIGTASSYCRSRPAPDRLSGSRRSARPAGPSLGPTRSSSRHPHRRRRHRPGAVRDRPPLVRSPGAPAAARDRRGRPAVPAPHARALRRDLRRRLPPALHPVLPDHARVLLAGALRGCAPAGR